MKILICSLVLLPFLSGCDAPQRAAPSDDWQCAFGVDKADLASSGTNPFFVLVPGYRCEYADHDGEGRLTISVLDQTEMIDGVETRVVEEREMDEGKLVEVSRNFCAISKTTKDVYYFGEDVDIYKDGKVVKHEGAWRSGVGGAKFGLMMPGATTVGRRYYQEYAPEVAMDRARILSTSASIKTPAGAFTGCLKVEETSPIEPNARDFKVYAPGIGLVEDGEMKLVSQGAIPAKH
jgi:hypothetical protein